MTLSRRAVVADVIRNAGDALVVAGLGTPCWDLYETGDRPEFFYMWNAMGLTAPLGLGLALAQPRRKVLVVTGDGDMMMGIGSLAVIGTQAPANLGILVLDNEMFGETGGQAGLTARGADIAAMASGAGIAKAKTVRTEAEAAGLAEFLLGGDGPALAVAKVATAKDPASYPTRDGVALARRFREAASGR